MGETAGVWVKTGCSADLPYWRVVDSMHRPRQWGARWLALHLWKELRPDHFWMQRLPPSRNGARSDQVLVVLTAYRLIAAGSE